MNKFELADLLVNLLSDGHEVDDAVAEIESVQSDEYGVLSVKLENGKKYLIHIVDENQGREEGEDYE